MVWNRPQVRNAASRENVDVKDPETQSASSDTVRKNPALPLAGERLIQLVLDKAPVSIFLAHVHSEAPDIRKRILYVDANEEFKRRTGVVIPASPQQASVGPFDHMPDTVAENCVHQILEAVRLNRTYRFQAYVDIAIGGRWIEMVAEPLIDEQSGQQQVLCIVKDITDFKNAEQLLAEQLKRDQALSKIASIALLENTIQSFMDQTCQILHETMSFDVSLLRKIVNNGTELKIKTGRGIGEDLLGKSDHKIREEMFSGYIIAKDILVTSRDVREEKRFCQYGFMDDLGVLSSIGAPIGGLYGTYGIISGHNRTTREFSVIDTEFFQAVADLISTAVKHYQSETVIEQNEELLNSILGAADIGICVCDSQGRFVRLNHAFSEITGYGLNQLKGRNYSMLYPIDRRESVHRAYDAFLADTSDNFVHEDTLTHRDGRRILVMIRGRKLSSRSSKLTTASNHVIFTVSDITEQRQRESELLMLKAVVVHSKNAIIILNAKREQTSPEIIYVNDSFTRITGFSKEEALGQTLFLLSSRNTDEESQELINKAIQQKGELKIDYLCRHKSGHDIWVEFMLIPVLNDQGVLSNWLVILNDITQRIEDQDALQIAKHQADQANKAKTQFLAEISHEVRTPLNAIIGFSDLMRQENIPSLSMAKYKGYVEDIYTSGMYLLGIINNILDLSKIEAGKGQLNEGEWDIYQLANDVFRIVAEHARQNDIRLYQNIADDIPAMRIDGIKIKQVLINLLTNAIKFTPKGGDVTLKIYRRKNLIIKVIDTGIGMSADDMGNALQPFDHAHHEKMGDKRGVGLGLPVSKALIELHGGSFSIESTVDQGTTVTVTIPESRLKKI